MVPNYLRINFALILTITVGLIFAPATLAEVRPANHNGEIHPPAQQAIPPEEVILQEGDAAEPGVRLRGAGPLQPVDPDVDFEADEPVNADNPIIENVDAPVAGGIGIPEQSSQPAGFIPPLAVLQAMSPRQLAALRLRLEFELSQITAPVLRWIFEEYPEEAEIIFGQNPFEAAEPANAFFHPVIKHVHQQLRYVGPHWRRINAFFHPIVHVHQQLRYVGLEVQNGHGNGMPEQSTEPVRLFPPIGRIRAMSPKDRMLLAEDILRQISVDTIHVARWIAGLSPELRELVFPNFQGVQRVDVDAVLNPNQWMPPEAFRNRENFIMHNAGIQDKRWDAWVAADREARNGD